MYDTARTSYQRLLQWDTLTREQREALERLYRSLNPLRLREQIDRELEKLWATARHSEEKGPR